jgi:cell shape-determining protein MreD
VTLSLLGLLQDQLSGGPLGFYMLIFLAAYLIGRIAATGMRTANLLSPMMGFAATAAGACLVALIMAQFVLGGGAGIGSFAIAALITVVLFPLVRPLYMGKSLTLERARV